MKWVFMSFLLVVLCISCRNPDKDSIMKLADEWKDKKILIPPHILGECLKIQKRAIGSQLISCLYFYYILI